MIYTIIIAGASFFNPQAQKDSLGIETVNGKIFVIHKVDEKETLFAISRRYGSSIDAILQNNPGATATLEVGQILKVPYEKKIPVKATAGNTVHKVAAGETMYSISRTYGVTVDEVKKWNNLTDNSISIGQELIVNKGSAPIKQTTVAKDAEPLTKSAPASGIHTVSGGETLYSIARQYGATVTQLRTWNSLESDEVKIGQDIFVTPENKRSSSPVVVKQDPRTDNPETKKDPAPPVTPKSEPTASQNTAQNKTIRISESLRNSDEIVEAGIAELIEGTEGNRKYLALHRSAPVGTILKVRNEMNNREVFVRVMGKLPDTAVNDKLIIKLSRSAYDRLGAIDPRFRVELTYYK